MQKITPFLWFNNQAEEAINFYTSIFKNSRIISITKYPDEKDLEGPMKGFAGKVLTGVFEIEGQRFMALDGGPVFQFSGATSFYVECEDQAEVDELWNKLTEGGDEKTQQCGWLTDKYGLTWQIIPKRLPELMQDPDPEVRKRVTHVMLQMKKIDINELEKAARGE